jgi:hypothetical protein
MSFDDIAKRISEAKTFEGGQYFTPGGYECVLTKMQVKDGYKGITFIAEHKILKSWVTEKDDKGADIQPSPAGSERSLVVSLSNPKTRDVAEGNVKAYILALLGFNADQVTPADFAKVFAELCGKEGFAAQPMRGKLVNTTAYTHQTKAGDDIVVNRWKHVPQTAESIAEMRKAL